MLKTLHIRNFRAIESLDIEDLGRVNLLIGRNSSGKTTVMEAACLAVGGPISFGVLRGSRKQSEAVANPMFFFLRAGDTERRFEVWGTRSENVASPRLTGSEGPAHALVANWEGKDYPITWVNGAPHYTELLLTTREPDWANQSSGSLGGAISRFVDLFREGHEAAITQSLRLINPGLESLDVIGEDIWYKLTDVRPRLPLSTLGDGALWLFDIAVGISNRVGPLCLDELDAGLHPTSLDQAVRIIQSAAPELQIFATTHSDECIRTACEVFRDAGDTGLRIIRLDRTGSGHRAAIYDRDAALLALESGWEIRG
ncbi:MAG: AAA family ATPase [Deltaproteobacteria bacterium]|nr:AAA family ATPase [Deltaproteobacteria bacterium]